MNAVVDMSDCTIPMAARSVEAKGFDDIDDVYDNGELISDDHEK